MAKALPPPPPPPREPEAKAPPELAEAAPAPESETRSPYVEIPLPRRARDLPPREEDARPPPAEAPMIQIPAPPRDPLPGGPVRRVAYVCEDGQDLTVLFDDRQGSATVLARGADPVALRSSPSADDDGFFYEGSGHVLFGAGARAGYASDGAEPVDCYTRGGRRQLSYREPPPRRTYGRDEDERAFEEAPDGR